MLVLGMYGSRVTLVPPLSNVIASHHAALEFTNLHLPENLVTLEEISLRR
jgi:hypothetical protein